jgi:hypothetical protein
MTTTSSQRSLRIISIVFAAVPFAFALMRAVSTRTDFRYLWLALASFLGATAVVMIARRRAGSIEGIALWAVAMLVATLLAGCAAILQGAKSGPGVWIVALGFGFCSAVGATSLRHD